MSTTRKKLDGPVRSGVWGLSLDRLVHPTTVTILRFADKSRHTRSFTDVASFPFSDDFDSLISGATEQSEMPPTHARTLARDLLAKVHSPRAALGTSPEE